MRSAIRFLRKEIHRWQSFVLRADPEQLEVALEFCTVPAPLLDEISLTSTDPEVLEEQFLLFDGNAPLLRTLHLCGVAIPWSGPLLRNLTSLEIRSIDVELGPSLEQLSSIFLECLQIRHLVLDASGITTLRNSEDFHPCRVVLPELEVFQATNLDRDFYFWMVQNLRAPNVHTYTANPENHDREFGEMIAKIPTETPLPGVRNLHCVYGQ